MNRLIGRVLACVLALGVISATAWTMMPVQVAGVLIGLNNLSAGLSAKTVQTDIGEIHYLEGGHGETILLVHGIYARKEHWVDVMRSLVDDYHVIAIDLPGFGDNAKLPDGQYTLDQQQENLLSVLQALELNHVHIAANSMGAYVAALLAAKRPDLMASFAFIGSPLGVPTPIKSDMDIARAQGDTPLVVQNAADFVNRNAWLAPEMPYVPQPILHSWMQSEVATPDHNARVWDVVHNQSSVPTLLELAKALPMPALVVWCRPDRIFHVSGAPLLDQALPVSTLAQLDQCGHLPMLDQPDRVAEIYQAFLAVAKAPRKNAEPPKSPP